jgi:hypothetical protein
MATSFRIRTLNAPLRSRAASGWRRRSASRSNPTGVSACGTKFAEAASQGALRDATPDEAICKTWEQATKPLQTRPKPLDLGTEHMGCGSFSVSR